MNDRLQFVYTQYVECCHNQDNELEKLDARLMSFFTEMYVYFNKTIIIFAADHGLRFGDIRKTAIGNIFGLFSYFYWSLTQVTYFAGLLEERSPP